MACQDYQAPNSSQESALAAQESALVGAAPVPSDRLYQFAALTVVLFMLATIL